MSDRAYAMQWKRYRRLRFHVWLGFAGFGLSGFAIAVLHLPSRFSWTIYTPIAFWLYLFIALIPYKNFPCPRCRRSFERRWPSKKYPDRNTCPLCGLENFSREK